jgi:DnaJ-class molecular chaperone
MSSGIVEDYYQLLGVHAGADGVELRRAWRRLASQYHPDRAGHAATAMFQRLSAAYEVLSDPLARAAYDRRRRRAGATSSTVTGQPRAADADSTINRAPRSVREPAPAVMLERLSGPLPSLIACGAARLDDDEAGGVGFITLVFREAEAAQGGMITISMRVELWCPKCAPQDGPPRERPAPARSSACTHCGGTRTVEELFSAWLAVPPGVKGGEVLVPSADLPGMVEPVRFRVRLAVTTR